MCTYICSTSVGASHGHAQCLSESTVCHTVYAATAFEDLGRILSLTWWSVKHSPWCYVHICMHTAMDLRTPFACCQHSRLLHIRIHFYPINKPFHSLQNCMYCTLLVVLTTHLARMFHVPGSTTRSGDTRETGTTETAGVDGEGPADCRLCCRTTKGTGGTTGSL